jgi:hypothetical protein
LPNCQVENPIEPLTIETLNHCLNDFDGCKKKFLLDSADQRHLVWGAIAARKLETCEDISCRITPPFPTPHYSVRIVYRTEKK